MPTQEFGQIWDIPVGTGAPGATDGLDLSKLGSSFRSSLFMVEVQLTNGTSIQLQIYLKEKYGAWYNPLDGANPGLIGNTTALASPGNYVQTLRDAGGFDRIYVRAAAGLNVGGVTAKCMLREVKEMRRGS